MTPNISGLCHIDDISELCHINDDIGNHLLPFSYLDHHVVYLTDFVT